MHSRAPDPSKWLLPLALVALTASGVRPARAGAAIAVEGKPNAFKVREGGKSLTYYRVDAAEGLRVSAEGPAVIALDIRELRRKRKAKGSRQATLTLRRDGAYQIQTKLKPSAARGKGGKASRSLYYAGKLAQQLKVPSGKHSYVLRLQGEQRDGFAVRVYEAEREVAKLLLGPEQTLASANEPDIAEIPLAEVPSPEPAAAQPAAPTPAEVAAEPAPEPSETAAQAGQAPASSPTPAAVVAAGKETRLSALGVSETDSHADADSKAPAGGAAQNERTTVTEITAPDDTVGGATRALADAVAKGFAARGAPAAFYRVAVPYFEELGQDVQDNNLGRLVAELLAVELSQRQPFVVVERERLSQIMREHRLKGLGLVDEQTAAEFGKVLGAQSLISGTVAEAGPRYVVAVRQVDVETGAVVVSGKVEIDRAGLVALSADAVVLRSKTGATFRSALIPGWGQLYNGETSKGVLFLGAGIGTVGSALGFYVAGNQARAKYESNEPGTVSKRAVANRRFETTNYLLMAYAALWAINTLDAYFSGTDATSVQVSAEPSGVAIRF